MFLLLTMFFFFITAADYSAPLGDLESFENEWVEVEMRPPKGWCEPVSPAIVSAASSPITIPTCDSIDESDVPPFLRDDIDMTESANEKDWIGKNRDLYVYNHYANNMNIRIFIKYNKKVNASNI